MSEFRLEKNPNAKTVPKRIALIRREAPARLLEGREEVTMTAPHLLVREVILIQACLIVLAVVSLLFDAPLEGIADPSTTPNPAKAPWYFLGLQELLHYFPPVVAGVLLPALVVIGIVLIPYVRVNLDAAGLYERPWRRSLSLLAALTALVSGILIVYEVWAVLVPTLAIFLLMALPALPACPAGWRHGLSKVPLSNWIMTWFVTVATLLTLIGVLFRGPGWAWVWPWRQGIS
jgi:quinol-cytochrome oxidoreductase complex cytochrome b subunit